MQFSDIFSFLHIVQLLILRDAEVSKSAYVGGIGLIFPDIMFSKLAEYTPPITSIHFSTILCIYFVQNAMRYSILYTPCKLLLYITSHIILKYSPKGESFYPSYVLEINSRRVAPVFSGHELLVQAPARSKVREDLSFDASAAPYRMISLPHMGYVCLPAA